MKPDISARTDVPRKVYPFLKYAFAAMPPRLKAGIGVVSLMTMSAAILNVSTTYGFKLLVDGLQASGKGGGDVWNVLRNPFLFVCLCLALYVVILRLRAVVESWVMPGMQDVIREILKNYLLRHSHEYFHNRFAGELVSKIDHLTRGWQNIAWMRLQFGIIPAFAGVATAMVLIWPVDRVIVCAMGGVIVALIVLSITGAKVLAGASARTARSESDIIGQMVDTVSNVASVKNFVRNENEFRLLRGLQDAYARNYRYLRWRQTTLWGMTEVVLTGFIAGLVWRLVDGWSAGHATIGDTAMCLLVVWGLWGRLIEMTASFLELSNDAGRMQAALNDIIEPHGIVDAPAAAALKVPAGAIAFENVGFSHRSGHKVFERLDLFVRPAEKVGIVGLSGAGKTTLCQLLLRNYDLTSGRIAIDGQDIGRVTQESLREAIAVIPQDPSLFHRSLKDNILYGSPGAAEEEVIAASKAAQAHAFISALKEGYDTIVGERGVKLSGGERQRISIARAILKNAPILILDEATSALDSQTERQIQAALATAMEGRTTLVIAHRLSTLAHLDRLVVLKGGKVEEEGTLSELLAKGGHFAELWRCQADGFLPEKF